MLTKEWFTAAEIAALNLPGLPGTTRGVHGFADNVGWMDGKDGLQWRTRKARGGGVEFHYSLLPSAARLALVLTHEQAAESDARATAKKHLSRDEVSAWFEKQSCRKQDAAKKRLTTLQVVRDLTDSGISKLAAMRAVAKENGVSIATLYNWEARTHAVPVQDRVAHLAPGHTGGAASAELDPDGWEFIKADYLRLERPTFRACYRRLERAATEHGWGDVPSERTLLRRMDDIPEPLRVLSREGVEALKRMFPAQRRDRGVFHALEAVNADGHKWDVFVRWPDGYVGRPMMTAFQDLYSGKMLSWRVDRSENKEAVRLAFGDLVEAHGIPDMCWLDNGRAFASKWLTGGTPNRYRFKVKDDDPTGIMTMLGVAVHWTTPYHGQAKPIERAFRDFAGDVAKHPRFAGAYTGNNPMAKPQNYASAAVPLDVFLAVLSEEVAAHNARAGRRSQVCQGRSFDDVFNESYAKSPIRKATAEQRRLWLMAAEGVIASRTDGTITLLGNRFWAEFLHENRGQKVTVRFDPEKLRKDVHVYRLDGAYLGAAPCIADAGFSDMDAAQQHNRDRNAFSKATKAALAAERKLSIADVAALLPEADEPPPAPETKVVRLVTRGSAALKPREHTAEEEQDAFFDGLAQMNAARRGGGHLRVVNPDEAGD